MARSHLGSLLKRVTKKKVWFVITKNGKPSAVLLGIEEFDDMVEELDPEFQRSLKIAAREFRKGKAIRLRDYLKERPVARRAG